MPPTTTAAALFRLRLLAPARPLATPRAVPSAPRHRIFRRAMASTAAASSTAAATPPAPILLQPVRLACIQLASGPDKAANLGRARARVLEAAAAGAKVIVLPECFNSPYGCDYFARYAEVLRPSPPPAAESPSFAALSAMAADAAAFLVGGSVPERDPATGRLYNTCLVFGPDGALLATHRKVHLFDIDIPGGITFRESDVLSAGDKVTVVHLPGYGAVSVALCYDVRFPELAAIAARRGCFALVYPGAFNTTTGPLHWRLLGRARAVDNQVYVALCSPARAPDATYQAWGHTLVADPMAEVLAEADEAETIVYADLDPAVIEQTRHRIPVWAQRRFDVYPDVSREKVRIEDPDLVEVEAGPGGSGSGRNS